MKIGLIKALACAWVACSALASPLTGQAAPTVTLSATPAAVAYGASATLHWGSTDASYCAIPWGSSATSGSYVTPGLFAPTTYTISCHGPAGASSASVTVATSGPPAAPTVSVSADPPVLPAGSATTLSWSSGNATSCNTPWGSAATAGTHTTEPITYERTFTVTCSGYGGSNAAYAAVRIGPTPAAPTVTLGASPASVAYGAATTLTWDSTNTTACSTPWGSTATAGSYATPPLTGTATYTVTCSGPGGTRSASATVTVAAPPPAAAPTVALAANPASIASGASSLLSWTSSNAIACSAPGGSTATSGSWLTPALSASSVYSVTCTGAGGSQSASATVTVAAAPPPPATGPTVSLTASPPSVSYGGSATLTWTSTNASACSVPWGPSATSGSYVTPGLFAASTFSITCYGAAGSASGSVTVAVSGPPPAPVVSLSADPASVAYGGVSTLTWSATDATSCNTPWGATATAGTYITPPITYEQTFTVTCSGYGGSNGSSVALRIRKVTPTPAPAPAPTVTLSASPAAVAYGASAVLNWSSSNASACSTPWGATATDGSYTTPALLADASYTVSCSGAGGAASASASIAVAPPVPPVTSETDPPLVFNASTSARAGDVVSLQGHHFGDAPLVYLDSAPTLPLEIVNRVGDGWLAVQIPAAAQGALTLRLRNATGTSAPVRLNAALPLHLDAIQLVAGGALRIFGRNLLLAGSVPTVLIDGKAAAVNLAQSDEHLLTVTAPSPLAATAAATILVDNGNGSGPALLDRRIEVVASSGSGDPFALGVGWAAGFAELATRTIDAASDARLSPKVVCDGSRDDSPAIQQAIELAASLGGGVVRLPAGRCRASGGMNLRSKVVVQGAGKDATELVYESNYPVFGVGLDLAGIRNLALTNAGPAVEGPLLKQSTRVFLQNVRVRIGRSSQMYLDGNRNAVIAGCDFSQTEGVSLQGPYTLNDSAGLVFEGNTTQWADGAPAFGRVHDSYLHANRFTRDGSAQNRSGTVHSMTIDFAYRVAVVGNTFDVAGGPITNTVRNDGETIITEGGGARRTENLGQVGSAGSKTLTDTDNTLLADPFDGGYTPENYGIAIVGGKGAGQTRRMVSYAWPTATVERDWDVIPDATSRYASFVWGLEKSLIKDNTLSQNPRGIWLYHTAIRDVDVIGNSISEGGGIYLRSYQNLAAKQFQPIYNVLIAQNRISNTSGRWMSYLNAVFVNADARAFGIADIGIEMRGNQIIANLPNAGSQTEEYANTEGIMNMMRIENYGGYESSAVPRLLGTIINGNSCTNCEVAVRIGTGAGGTTILNTQLFGSPVLWSDWATTGTGEKSSGTVVR